MKKFKNKKGFTLAELLIVVAIVAVLVAISIPIFSGKLNKAKVATNQANVRAAKAAAVADFLSEGKDAPMYYLYDVNDGKIEEKDKNTATADSNTDKILTKVGVKIELDTKGETTVTTDPNMEDITVEKVDGK